MTYHSRQIDQQLAAWLDAPPRKPLVLRGARQTGKTTAIRRLGERVDLLIELNLERYADRRLVESCRSADDLITILQVRHDVARLPARTLLFLDEVQEVPEAVAWLRFLGEDYPDIAVVAAGSLMEVRLQERGFSFPVGRVTFRHLHPFSFLEYLSAVGRGVLVEHLRNAAALLRPLPEPLLDEATTQLRDYLLVGGMPEAVGRWAETRSPVLVRQVHGDLVQAIAEDIQKYRGVRDVGFIEAAYDNLRHHYGLRFKYEGFAPGFRSDQMKMAIARLEGAMIVRRVWPTASTSLPLQTRARAAPKLLPLDVGLALTTMGVPFAEVQSQPIDAILDGRVAEMFVGQQILSTHVLTDEPMHFWTRDTAEGNAEIDYLVPRGDGLRAVEVKAGASGTLKSLHQFLRRSGQRTGWRLHGGGLDDTTGEVRVDGASMPWRLVSLPLAMSELIADAGSEA